MNLATETLEYLNKKHSMEPFDLSPLTNLAPLTRGFCYEYDDNTFAGKRYIICSCGFLLNKIKSVYSPCCPLCGNKTFARTKSLKFKDDDAKLSQKEQKELPFTKAREIRLVSDLVLDFDIENKKVKLGKFKINYKLDVVRKKIHIIDLENLLFEFKYENGLWYALDEKGNFKDEQIYPEMFITFNGLFSSLPNNERESYIKDFLTGYNQIVEKEKQVHYFEGFDIHSIFISLISRNFYIVTEYFETSFNELYQLDIEKDTPSTHKVQRRTSSPFNVRQTLSKKLLYQYFKPLKLEDYHYGNIDDQFNLYAKHGVIGNEVMINGKVETENVYKILGLPKSVVKSLKTVDNFKTKNKSHQFASLIKKIKNNLDKVELQTMVSLIGLLGVNLEGYDFVFKLMKAHPTKKPDRIAQYLVSLEEKGLFKMKDAYDLYKDYISMSEQMNLNFNVFPKNLRKVHDVRVIDFNIAKEKEKELLFNRIYSYPDTMDVNEEYVMLKPKSSYDLMKEGQDLNHCVGSYAQAVLDKRSLIFFLRKKNNLTKALVTIELNPTSKSVVQQKGKHNRATTKDERNAIKLWHDKYILNKNH